MDEPSLYFKKLQGKVLYNINNFIRKGILLAEYVDCCYKQIVFRFLYNIYIKAAPRQTLYQCFNSHGSKYDNGEYYRAWQRDFKELEEHQIVSYKVHQAGNIGAAPTLRESNNFVIADYQKFQQCILREKRAVLYKFANLRPENTNNYSNRDFIEDCKEFEDIYTKIENLKESYFIKCLQYYQLEIAYRHETLYKYFMIMKQHGFSASRMKKDVEILKGIFGVRIPVGEENNIQKYSLLQNTLMLDTDILLQFYNDDENSLNKIIAINVFLNKFVLYNVSILDYNISLIDDIKAVISTDTANSFFENFIGRGQHITKNKDYEKDINVKYFRKVY